MLPTRRAALAAAFLLGGLHAASAQTLQTAPISAVQAWARPTPGGATTGVVYLTLTAKDHADRLVGASTPAAGMAELHISFEDNGVMKMRPVEGLSLMPGQPVELKPGGYHLMLMDLKQPLKTGDSFPVTLTFDHAKPLTVSVTVATMGGKMPADHDMGAMHGEGHGAGHMHDMGAMPGTKP